MWPPVKERADEVNDRSLLPPPVKKVKLRMSTVKASMLLALALTALQLEIKYLLETLINLPSTFYRNLKRNQLS